MRRFIVWQIYTVLLFAAPATLLAQAGGDAMSHLLSGGTVSGQGVVKIERYPDVMRLQIAILGKSNTLKDALTTLKDRSQAARLQVVAMGAGKESINIGEPELSAAKSNEQQRMERMILQQMRAAGRKRKKANVKASITVSATLTAQWPLKGKTTEELLIEIHELQETIKAADLAGLEETSKLSAAEQEILEEMEGSGYSGFGSDDETKPGQPVFTFVSAISQEEHDRATADAFKKAKAQAERLAKAAGATLGPLRSLTSNPANMNDSSEYGVYGGYDSYIYRMMQMNTASHQAEKDAGPEAVGMKPGKVKYGVHIQASFTLKEK